jgi:DNA-binding PadR family transcriptional regulator
MGLATVTILAALRTNVRYGLDLIQTTGLLPGTVYTTLRRLEKRGLVEGRWEEAEVAEAERRPRRRYYRLTPKAHTELEAAAARLGDLAAELDLLPAARDRQA